MYASLRARRSGSCSSDARAALIAGDQALRRGFFVARRSVELSAVIKSGDAPRFERVAKFRRRDHIVLDCVAGAHHRALFQARQRVQHLELHFGRQRRRKTADVERRLLPALGLDEDLMRRIVRELHDFVFDRRTVARPDAANQIEAVERRAVQIIAHERVRALVGFGDVARQLRAGECGRAASTKKASGTSLGAARPCGLRRRSCGRCAAACRSSDGASESRARAARGRDRSPALRRSALRPHDVAAKRLAAQERTGRKHDAPREILAAVRRRRRRGSAPSSTISPSTRPRTIFRFGCARSSSIARRA